MWSTNTKDIIAQALYELLQMNKIQDITVTDIISHSNISKRTFYNYFLDKFDAVIYIFTKIDCKYNKDVGFGIIDTLTQTDVHNKFYMFLHRNFFLNTFCYTGQNNLMDYMAKKWRDQWIEEIQTKSNDKEITKEIIAAIEMFCYGTTSVLYAMIRGVLPVPDRMTMPYLQVCMPKALYDVLNELNEL